MKNILQTEQGLDTYAGNAEMRASKHKFTLS
jgi:hypothetical protein